MSKRLIIRGLLSLYKFPLFLVLGGGGDNPTTFIVRDENGEGYWEIEIIDEPVYSPQYEADWGFTSFNNFRRAAGCGPARFLTKKDDGDPVEKAIGAKFDRTEVRDYYGRKYFIGDSLNQKGECLLRTIGVEKMVHWPTYVFGDLLWEHLKHFARDVETGELIRL